MYKPFKNLRDNIFRIAQVDENNTTGMNGLLPKLKRIAALVHLLVEQLTKIFNLSIGTGKFHTKWKMGKGTPIHKSGSGSDE